MKYKMVDQLYSNKIKKKTKPEVMMGCLPCHRYCRSHVGLAMLQHGFHADSLGGQCPPHQHTPSEVAVRQPSPPSLLP